MFKRFFIYSILFIILSTTFCLNTPLSFNASADEAIELESKSACLYDFSSGEILFEKDATQHLPIASMVKMMTILLTLEEIDKGNLTEETMITTTENASGMGGSQVFIDPYVKYSLGVLLKSVIIASANDASVALAEHISGSEKSFVNKMNERAKQLGMNNTNYSNCTGLPAPEQYSCAVDCAIVLREVSKHELYHKYCTIWMDEVVHPSGRKTEIVNTNRLVRYYDGCDGGKTGSTNEAGCCLSASAKRNNMKLISVIIGAPNSQTRFNECSKLFNFGFANYENKEILNTEKAITTINVNKGKVEKIDLFAKEGFSAVVKKGKNLNYEVSIDCPSKITAPKDIGEVIGKVYISKNGSIVKEVELILNEKLEKVSLKDCFEKVVTTW